MEDPPEDPPEDPDPPCCQHDSRAKGFAIRSNTYNATESRDEEKDARGRRYPQRQPDGGSDGTEKTDDPHTETHQPPPQNRNRARRLVTTPTDPGLDPKQGSGAE